MRRGTVVCRLVEASAEKQRRNEICRNLSKFVEICRKGHCTHELLERILEFAADRGLPLLPLLPPLALDRHPERA